MAFEGKTTQVTKVKSALIEEEAEEFDVGITTEDIERREKRRGIRSEERDMVQEGGTQELEQTEESQTRQTSQ